MGYLKTCFSELVDVGEAKTLAGRSLLEERFRALKRQVPLLYATALANFIGLHVATNGLEFIFSPSLLLAGLVLLRLVHWVRNRHRTLPPERILRELKRVFLLALGFCLAFMAWGIYLMETGPGA